MMQVSFVAWLSTVIAGGTLGILVGLFIPVVACMVDRDESSHGWYVRLPFYTMPWGGVAGAVIAAWLCRNLIG